MQWVMGVFFKYMIILQIRTRGNASFNDLSKLINTLSNQDFAGLGKFRLRESLGKMKRMHVQLVKVNKNNRNESNLSEFFSSIFLLQCQSQCQWETYQCHWVLEKMHPWHWKKESLCWEVRFRHRLKKFLLYRDCFYIEYVHRRGNSKVD